MCVCNKKGIQGEEMSKFNNDRMFCFFYFCLFFKLPLLKASTRLPLDRTLQIEPTPSYE